MRDFIAGVMRIAETARTELAQDAVVGPFVDMSLPVPKPFMGTGDIKLIIIGQDPTIQNIKSRSKITVTLNLDKKGSLRTYLAAISTSLGFSLDEHIYATNLCKNFFIDPPTTIVKESHINVVEKSAPIWLPVLAHELAAFPNVPVISLGEPLLSALILDGHVRKVGYYWGWNHSKRRVDHPMSAVAVGGSAFRRLFFPFPHQPTMRNTRNPFYKDHLSEYQAFVKTQISIQGTN